MIQTGSTMRSLYTKTRSWRPSLLASMMAFVVVVFVAGLALAVLNLLSGCAVLAGIDEVTYRSIEEDAAAQGAPGRVETVREDAAKGDAGSDPDGSTTAEAGEDSAANADAGADGPGAVQDAAADTAVTCDGPVYTHHIAIVGGTPSSVTWQDCVPTGTYDEVQALAACNAYAQAMRCDGSTCTDSNACALDAAANSNVTYGSSCQSGEFLWSYGNAAAPGHVNSQSTCPSTQDPTWD
jgi:hypothetical protein